MNKTNPTIRAVFFDLGQVLLDFDSVTVATKMAAMTGKSPLEIGQLVRDVVAESGYELGGISSEEFVRLVSERCGVALDFAAFADAWCDIFSENAPMVSLARTLRGTVPRFILSNTNDLHIDFVRRKFPFFGEFDGYVLSYRDRVAKPDAAIYRLALERAGVEAGESLFIDDREENVLGAGAVGMNFVHYADRTQAMKEIQSWLQIA